MLYYRYIPPKKYEEKGEGETQREVCMYMYIYIYVYIDFNMKTHLAKVSRVFVVSFQFFQTSGYNKMQVSLKILQP